MLASSTASDMVQTKLAECRQLTEVCHLSRQVREQTAAVNGALDGIVAQLEVMCDVMANWSSVFSNMHTI
ncbi:hypothetical protein H4R34_000638, partial [Dimargaris verticillata]